MQPRGNSSGFFGRLLQAASSGGFFGRACGSSARQQQLLHAREVRHFGHKQSCATDSPGHGQPRRSSIVFFEQRLLRALHARSHDPRHTSTHLAVCVAAHIDRRVYLQEHRLRTEYLGAGERGVGWGQRRGGSVSAAAKRAPVSQVLLQILARLLTSLDSRQSQMISSSASGAWVARGEAWRASVCVLEP